MKKETVFLINVDGAARPEFMWLADMRRRVDGGIDLKRSDWVGDALCFPMGPILLDTLDSLGRVGLAAFAIPLDDVLADA
jgi:hypothetical protein